MGQGQSASSKVDTAVEDGEVAFFAKRDAPVQFSEGLINQLSSNTISGSSSSHPSQARQETLDSHIQARITAELSRLRDQEQSVREEIERALEKENLSKELGAEDGKPGVSHSKSLLKDLEDLEKRTLGLREEIVKSKQGEAWTQVQAGEKALQECFLSNKTTPLNCREQAQAFFNSVAGVEKAFVESV
ncbi:hypothetical protein T439DRAFT_376998 [Meredithblackwellia eburnea MCA 4105]